VQTQLEKREDRSCHKREKTEMAWVRSANGRQQTAKTGCTLVQRETLEDDERTG